MPYASGARYRSGKQCLAGIREEILDEITNWINDSGDTRRVCLLSGAAGTGRSVIAHTIARRFNDIGRLGSSYCFDRSDPLNRCPDNIFPTMARDLAGHDLLINRALGDIVHNNPSLRKTRDLSDQFSSLILKPTAQLTITRPIVIVIDALDESSDVRLRRVLLSLLAKDTKNRPSNFRILIASCPEQDILASFSGKLGNFFKSMPDSIADPTTSRDIFTYIRVHLADGDGEHLSFDDNKCRELAAKSEGLFQSAFVAQITWKNTDIVFWP